jgi:hypothetical protein
LQDFAYENAKLVCASGKEKTMKHGFGRPGIVLAVLVMLGAMLFTLLAAGRPVAANGSGQVPFKGRIVGTLVQEALSDPPINWSVEISGTGQATHLGRVAVFITNADVGLGNGILVPNAPTGTGTFIGPKGDKVFGEYSWAAFPTLNPDVLAFRGTCTITGGEGRFAGATGGGTFSGEGDMSTNEVVASFNGTISPPRQNK